ncbi:MAG: 50S ribosomal protein L5 [bacterium]
MMNRLIKKYREEIVPALKAELGLSNQMAVPKLVKAVVSIGTGQGLRDPRFNEVAEDTLIRITGQKPITTLAKKSIATFKIRQGMKVGLKVTLRGRRLYDFVDKLVNISLPRIRDFRGLEAKLMDGQGNLTIGFKEHLSFPEIKSDEVEKIHGLEVTIVTTAKNDKDGLALFRKLGFPIKETNK